MQEILRGSTHTGTSPSTAGIVLGLGHSSHTSIPSSPSRTNSSGRRQSDREISPDRKVSYDDRKSLADIRLATTREATILKEHDATLHIVPERYHGVASTSMSKDVAHSTVYHQHYSGLEVSMDE